MKTEKKIFKKAICGSTNQKHNRLIIMLDCGHKIVVAEGVPVESYQHGSTEIFPCYFCKSN